ncbi:response regulator [Rubrivirga sp.]|uniref:response regulator n=1 Tax=Rubrivirga sp. TaxID=1885344 RepID=UPI003B515E24
MPTPTRVVLAEDHDLLRALLRSTLAACPDLVVVGEAATGGEAIRLVRAVRPDVLVLDIQLAGDQDGVDVATRVAGGACHVLAYSSHNDPVHVAHLLRAGASGYLSKEAPVHRVVEAIRAVAAGESRWFEAGVDSTVRLAPDELRALAHFATGGRPDTLARALGTSAVEATDVLAGLYARLGASSWYEALARGWALGLIGPGRVREPVGARGYSIRAKRPGQARAARAGSYGA